MSTLYDIDCSAFQQCDEVNIWVVYEDWIAWEAARQASLWIVACLSEQQPYECRFWSFAEVAQPGREEWRLWMGNADLLIVAARGGYGLPVETLRSIESWIPSESPPRAGLIGLIDDQGDLGHGEAVRQYLKNAADRIGGRLYWHVYPLDEVARKAKETNGASVGGPSAGRVLRRICR